MKRNSNLLLMLFIVLVTVLASCHAKDNTIKADLATRAKEEKDFAGVTFIVEDGIVTLNGECPTEKSKGTVEKTVKDLYGVKNVVNNIRIAPVVIGVDQQLKESVDSVLKQYASVEAITKDSIVYLTGRIESDKRKKLTDAINSLKPLTVVNGLSAK
jgi:osmotically-inducible protein OsmY